jgi:hypothetical protein
MGWNPWAHIGKHYPHIRVVLDQELPAQVWGMQAGDCIWLCRRLNQVRRRCTLAHEIGHLERGIAPTNPIALVKEERAVSRLAAKRLITIDALTEALRWTREPHQLAEALWVDIPTLEARMQSLDPIEVAQLENELDGQWTP